MIVEEGGYTEEKKPIIRKIGEVCSSLLIKKDILPQKLEDTGSFSFPCTIGSFTVDRALADLGASINVVSSSMCKRLGLGTLKPMRMAINLVDRSVRHPKRVIEDVLVKIKELVFPVDFIVLDMEDGIDFPIILGRPFLRTSSAFIDIEKGKLVLRVGRNEIVFKFPLLPIPTSKTQDTFCVINHKTDEVSLNV
ncbi:hypothetical protein M9H77_20685 [Catharanthus roseus]|uniref:Uncharacterized protein n=1 Tax=Catharanthus roseus TaxID=4058 RepID=A0ACC0AK73_CATRO|nr:hypothetical protein M9H77_20685 [Catharanthus roseus]